MANFWADERIASKPLEVFDELIGAPALWCDGAGADPRYSKGFWLVRNAADIRAAFQQPHLFSSNTHAADASLGRPGIPINIDPPDHTAYRRPLAALFSPSIVTKLRAHIETSARQLLDEFVPDGSCEFVTAFGRSLPADTYVGLLGGEPSDTPRFVGWTEEILHNPTIEGRRTANREAVVYLTEIVKDRIEQPRDDVLSSIVGLTIGDRPITLDEAIRTSYLLMLAGLDTVTASLTFAMWFLAESPEHQKLLATQPEVIPAAVDELLRRASVANAIRTCVADVEFAGVSMRAGDVVILPPVMASRDPEEFEDPTVVDFERSNANRHFAFGAGPHRCLGVHLAKEQMRVALTEWHQRIPSYGTSEGFQPAAYWDTIIGLQSLELSW